MNRTEDEMNQRQWRTLQWATIGTMVLCCAISLSLNLVDPDLWGHVRYGQDWLQQGHLPRTASHTFTAVGYPWINHENLAELAMAEGYRLIGPYGLLVAKCLLGLCILVAMVRTASIKGVPHLMAWALMLLVARNLTAFFPMRPQLFSFLCCAVMLVSLDRAFCQWHSLWKVRWAWLWTIPVIFVIWVNSHGAFVAGLCILGAYLAGRMVELAVSRGTAGWPTQIGLASIGVSALALTSINPYGLNMHRWLFASLGQPRPEITEWAAPTPGDPVFWPFLVLGLIVVVSLAASRRQSDWPQIVILTLVAWQATMHLRHIAYFSLLCGFWLPVDLHSALGRLRPTKSNPLPDLKLAPWLRRFVAATLIGTIGLECYGLSERLTDWPVQRNRFPVDAVQFMSDKQLGGKLVVCFNWAQYAIAALAPDVQVAFDGRFRTCYPQNVVDMHFDFLVGEYDGRRSRSDESGPIDGTRVLDYGSPDLVLVDRQMDHAVAIMKAQMKQEAPKWTLLYRDTTAELWGRQSRYGDRMSPHYFPASKRLLDPPPREGSVQWPAFPQ